MRRTAFFVAGALVLAVAGVAGGAVAQEVTLSARTTIVGPPRPVVVLSGRIPSAKEGELVTIEGKECGVPGAFFRAMGGTQTNAGGTWAVDQYIRSTTQIRAVWESKESNALTVRMRVTVQLFSRLGNTFDVDVSALLLNMYRKQVVIERFDKRFGKWTRVRTVPLRGDYAGFAETDRFKVDVPKGTSIRAQFPLAQAGPCYLAGYSRTLRT